MSLFKGKTLLITGGTGSFGNAVLNRFLKTDIGEIRIFSRDEKKQDDMRHEFQAKMPEVAEIYKEMNWSRAADSKVVATFTIETYSGLELNVNDIKTNVSLDGVGHGHGHGHGHGNNTNAGGGISIAE